jgi:hypothetical protein
VVPLFSVKVEFPGRAQDIHAVPPGAAFLFGHSDGTYTALKATIGDQQGFTILCTPREGVWSGADLHFAGDHNPTSAGAPSALKRFAFYEGLVLRDNPTVFELANTRLIVSPFQKAFRFESGTNWTPGSLFAVQNHPPFLAISAQEEEWLLDVTTGSATQPRSTGVAIEITQWALVLELSGKRVILHTHPAGSEAAAFV